MLTNMKHIPTFESFLNESKIAANTLGNRIKSCTKGSTVIIDDITYMCLGGGKWESSNDEKLNWVELSAKAAAKGGDEIEFNKK